MADIIPFPTRPVPVKLRLDPTLSMRFLSWLLDQPEVTDLTPEQMALGAKALVIVRKEP